MTRMIPAVFRASVNLLLRRMIVMITHVTQMRVMAQGMFCPIIQIGNSEKLNFTHPKDARSFSSSAAAV